MKDISETLQSSLSGEALTLCLCWKLRRRDGVEIYITDHDQALEVDSDLYEPGAAISGAVFSQTADLRPGRVSAGGALSSNAIDEDDLIAGLWNGAEVQVSRVDWKSPEHGGILVWSGYLSEITLSQQGQFEAELVSLKSALEKPVGRTISRSCSAMFGDTMCGVTPEAGQSCDKSFHTCQNVFDNVQRFRGYPHLPGPDFVLAGPAGNGTDGGKR